MATLTPQPPYPSGLEARLPPCLSLEGPRCLTDLASLIGSTDCDSKPRLSLIKHFFNAHPLHSSGQLWTFNCLQAIHSAHGLDPAPSEARLMLVDIFPSFLLTSPEERRAVFSL